MSSNIGSSESPTTETPTTATPGRKRRRRTRSHNSSPSPTTRGFFVPGFDVTASGQHTMMSLSELMDTAKGVTNMILAHEIAVDKNFKLEKLKSDDDDDDGDGGRTNVMEREVKRIVHNAFWDLLDEQLKQDPPRYDGTISILREMKDVILTLLVMPQHTKLKEDIESKFDLDLIRQQADNGVLDIENYGHYVLDLMSKLCAPIRDDEITTLRRQMKRTCIVPILRGIMDTLDHMKLDMANYTLLQAKPLIISKSVEYEREKFREFLSKTSSSSSNGDNNYEEGLKSTKEWFLRHTPSTSSEPRKLLIIRILLDSYIDLLEWDDYYPLPETLVMDQKRIRNLRDLVERTSVSTAVILVAFSNVAKVVVPADSQKLKEKMKYDIDILLQDFRTDEDLLEILPKIAEQIIKIVDDYLTKEKNKDPLPEEIIGTIKRNIVEMEDPNHRIRDLVQRRILEFCKQAISRSSTSTSTSKGNHPLQVPPGLTLCQRQLGQIAGAFVQLVSYNRAVFNDTYYQLIENYVLFQDNVEIGETRKSREA